MTTFAKQSNKDTYVEHNIAMFSLGIATAVIMAEAILFRYKKDTPMKRVLGRILFFWAILLMKDLLLAIDSVKTSAYLRTVVVQFDMLAVPCCVFYLKSIFDRRSLTPAYVALWLAPYIGFFVLFIATGQMWFHFATIIFSIVYGTVVWMRIFRKIHLYNKSILNSYADIERIDVGWLRTAAALLWSLLIVWCFTCFIDNPYLDTLYYTISWCMWTFVSYRTYLLAVPECGTLYSGEPDGEDIAGENGVLQNEFVEKLEHLLNNENIYLRCGLTLNDLAEACGTNRSYLSRYINTCLNTTFYDYINSLRINRRAVPLLRDNNNFTIDYIAKSSGFSNCSTFRRAFMKFVGDTPDNFRRAHSGSKG